MKREVDKRERLLVVQLSDKGQRGVQEGALKLTELEPRRGGRIRFDEGLRAGVG